MWHGLLQFGLLDGFSLPWIGHSYSDRNNIIEFSHTYIVHIDFLVDFAEQSSLVQCGGHSIAVRWGCSKIMVMKSTIIIGFVD